MDIHDLLILGGGPAGYTAALYAARAGLDTLLLEQRGPGGQMAQAHRIDNYPGFDEGIAGYELALRMQRGAARFGAQTAAARVTALALDAAPFRARTAEAEFAGRALILAMGAEPRTLGLPGEDALTGHGVSYCAACDGMLYRGRTVAVVGGGNSAAADALLLSRVAAQVVLIHRRDRLRADAVLTRALDAAPNVCFRWDSAVTALCGSEALTGIRLRHLRTGAEELLPCEGLFVCIGRTPATALLRDWLPLDDAGYVPADETTRTAIPGVFAAGDLRRKPLRQVITAAADGAAAAHAAAEFLHFTENLQSLN